MQRTLKVLKFAVFGIVGLAVIAAAALFVRSEWILRKNYPSELRGFESSVPDLVEGERLARLRGCADGCHGPGNQGNVFIDDWVMARVNAPNLTRVIPEYSDAELERLLRQGVRKDGRSSLVMPSAMLSGLADEDLALIVSYLRSLPPVDGPGRRLSVGPLARVALSLGQFSPAAAEVQLNPPRTVPRDDPLAFGRYLARTVCTECHGVDLGGNPMSGSPDLRITAAFGEEDFVRLMREGRGLEGRELGLMADVAVGRFAHFTDEEIGALYAFLTDRASRPPAEAESD